MRYLVLPVCLLCLLVVLPGCPTEEPEEVPDLTWDPPLTDNSGGELDFGAVPEGSQAEEQITVTNNTEETITFEIDVDLSGGGWLVNTPGITDVEGGDSLSWGPRFNPTAGTDDEAGGTVAFLWDNHIVTYVVTATVDRD